MIRKALAGTGIIIGVLALALGVWTQLYSDPIDPKNLGYILWKHDLYNIDRADAVAAMIGDPQREVLVVGKSKGQLEKRFGHLLTLSEVPPYIRKCYHEYGEEPGHDVRFIAESDWMVIFSGNTAIKLVLIKSCY